MRDKKDVELPQHNRLLRAIDPQQLLNGASDVLELDLASIHSAKKIDPRKKEKRDMLVYLLWKTGRLSNQELVHWTSGSSKDAYGRSANTALARVVLPDWRGPVKVIIGKPRRRVRCVTLYYLYKLSFSPFKVRISLLK